MTATTPRRLDPAECPTCHGAVLIDETDGTMEPCYDEHHQAIAADPIKYDALRARILAQLTEQRHADAERHSEARAGAAYMIHHTDHARPCQMSPAGIAWWTKVTREDRAADYAGQPPTMPGPIMAAASAIQQTEDER